jgi:uncharacterized protein YutE (UPF0331/DUF86 family)
MVDDVVLNKVEIIERCAARVSDVHAGDDRNLFEDVTRQDSIILNLQRACEAAIDLAMHVVSSERLGVPQESRHAFDLLEQAGRIPPELASTLRRMVGFRNVAVHAYREIALDVVKATVDSGLHDLLAFGRALLAR